MQARILAMVLAGGKGTRLGPLTRERSKPAVPFGGKYRIIDFVLSNLINSGIYSIYVLTQFKAQSLLQHLRDGWQFSDILKNQFVISVPAQMRKGEKWYEGTSDAIFQNIHLIGSSGFLVGGQRVAGSSILPTRRRPQSHRSPKGGQEIPKYPTRQSGRGQLVKGIRH